jgi:hypothetical protein
MSIPICCSKCDAVIGELSSLTNLSGTLKEIIPPAVVTEEDGSTCNHPKPKRTEYLGYKGLIKVVCLEYPETMTDSTWGEYIGPPERRMLQKAICSSREYPDGSYDGLLVNGQWAWWTRKYGLLGYGVAELDKLKRAQKKSEGSIGKKILEFLRLLVDRW